MTLEDLKIHVEKRIEEYEERCNQKYIEELQRYEVLKAQIEFKEILQIINQIQIDENK